MYVFLVFHNANNATTIYYMNFKRFYIKHHGYEKQSQLLFKINFFAYLQGLLYFIYLFMGVEEPILVTQYSLYLQPIMIISILLGIYSLTIVTRTLHPLAPGKTINLHLSIIYSIAYV